MSCAATLPDVKGDAPHDRDSRASASTCAGSTVCRVELLNTIELFFKRIAFSNKSTDRTCEGPSEEATGSMALSLGISSLVEAL